MIDKIEGGQIQDIVGKLTPKQPDSPKVPVNDDVDASLHVDYGSLINQATQIPDTDTKTIQQVQELLQSGQLESPENIREAAENIVKYGV